MTWRAGHARHLPYADVRDEALCWGWVDSQARAVDADRTATRMSPRAPRSPWSAINRARVAALEASGRMHPPGLAAVVRAQSDGSWDALALADDPDRPPPALLAAIAVPDPLARWLALPRSRRRALLEQIALARTEPTRVRRINAAAACATDRAAAP